MVDIIDIVCGNGHDPRWRLRSALDVAFRPLRWMWQDRVPLGAVTLMPGREGLGKSLVAHDIAARATRGELAGDLRGVPVDVIVIGAEDTIETVSGPRFVAAGADLSRVHYLDALDDGGYVWAVLDGLRDLEQLAGEVERLGLVIIDPLDAHLDVDTHKKGETQRAIGMLTQFAQQCDAAVLGLAHHNKGATTDPLRLVTGSVAFTTSVRSVLSVAPHPHDPAERVLAVSKANLCNREQVPVLRFRLEGRAIATENDVLLSTAAVVWLGEADDVDPDELFRAGDPDEGERLREAQEFLTAALAGGPRPLRELLAEARREGIADRTLARARRSLSVKVERTGFPARSVWMLPVASDMPADDGTTGHGTTGHGPETRPGGGFWLVEDG